jgi:hypothetical protein
MDVLNSVRGLTLQLFSKLGNFLLVVIVSLHGALQAEFLGSDLFSPSTTLSSRCSTLSSSVLIWEANLLVEIFRSRTAEESTSAST